MKIRISPAPTPYKPANPEDVVITSIQPSFSYGTLVAWGYLKSEMVPNYNLQSLDLTRALNFPQDYEPSREYVIGHSPGKGMPWFQEGDLVGVELDPSIVSQIERLMEGPTAVQHNKEV